MNTHLREAHFFCRPLFVTHSHAHHRESRERPVQAFREDVWGSTRYMVQEEGRAEWGGLQWLKPWNLCTRLTLCDLNNPIRTCPTHKSVNSTVFSIKHYQH